MNYIPWMFLVWLGIYVYRNRTPSSHESLTVGDFFRQYSANDAYPTQSRVYPYSIGIVVDGWFQPVVLEPPVENQGLVPLMKVYKTAYYAERPGFFLGHTRMTHFTIGHKTRWYTFEFHDSDLYYVNDRMWTGATFNFTHVASDPGVSSLVEAIRNMGMDAYMVTEMWTASYQLRIKHDGNLTLWMEDLSVTLVGRPPSVYTRLDGYAYAVKLVPLL
jgi:hypothetical protein